MSSLSITRKCAELPVYLSSEKTAALLNGLNCTWVENYGPASIWQTARGFRFTVEEPCEERGWRQILSEIAAYL
jgi:hypothetical protein